MRTFSNATIGDQPIASNRRQPVRQTRTNPARTATNVVQSQAGALAQVPDGDRNANPGFYPAITHFTDAITALPKEMIRHYTMLKEVDAKTHGPEALLGQYLNAAMKAQKPLQQQAPRTQANKAENATFTATSNGLSSADDTGNGSQPIAHDDPTHLARRGHFHNMRLAMLEMLQTLDEKNHVLNTAIDSLDKQMKRCNSSYPYIEDEISEEARYGSLTHWAYTDKSAEKKGMIAGERTRRAANTAAAAAQQEAEGAAMRSETRREALAARKHRNQHMDSDFDDGRAISKNPKSGGKGRKAADANLGTAVGLGISNGAAPPNKRRKVEKATGGLSAERAMASVYGATGGTGRGVASSPRDIPGNDATGKKRGRGGSLAMNGTGRKRTNTNASTVNPPSLVSSSVVATFTAAKDRGGRSPAPSMMQRLPSARARQNSTQAVVQSARNRSSSTNVRATNGHGLYGTTADVVKVSGLTGRTLGDVKSSMKETVNVKGEHLVEDIGTGDGTSDMRGGLVVGSRNPDRLKREETENGSSRTREDRPPSISVSTRGGGNSKGPSKTATPINASFAEPHRTRGPRASEAPLKRSHKKGAGLAAQIAAAAAVQDGEDSSIQGEGEEDEEDGPGQEKYCYCDGISYGEMVGCDGDNCEKEWFHLDCVGLSRAPAKNAKWYCDECKENLKSAKFNGGSGR